MQPMYDPSMQMNMYQNQMQGYQMQGHQPVAQAPAPVAPAPTAPAADNPFAASMAANPFGGGSGSTFKPTVKEFKPEEKKAIFEDEDDGGDPFAHLQAKSKNNKPGKQKQT